MSLRCGAVVFAVGLGLATAQAAGLPVVVNGRAVDAGTLMALQQRTGIVAQPGRYWYDARSGAFGTEGQSTLGFLPAGLALGGPLSPAASGGGDGRFGGVFINGRELHPLDVAALTRHIGGVLPGRYWVDAMGNFGYEHGPPLGNLHALAQMRGGGAAGPRGSRSTTCVNPADCANTRSWLGQGYFSDGASGCIVMEGEVSC
jgi:hypothetical protein